MRARWGSRRPYGASARINNPGRRTVPLEARCERAVEHLVPWGSLAVVRGARITNAPRLIWLVSDCCACPCSSLLAGSP